MSADVLSLASRAQPGERRRADKCGHSADPGLRIGGKFGDTGHMKAAEPCNRKSGCTALPMSGGALQQVLGLALYVEARILIGLGAGECGDALHEIEDAFGFTVFFR